MNDVLAHFKIKEADFIGAGSESAVYRLSETQILRVYPLGAQLQKIEQLNYFYSRLQANNLPFALPQITRFGMIGSYVFSIEPRLPGRELTAVFPTFSQPQRRSAIQHYIEAAAQIRQITPPSHTFGELLVDTPIQAETWVDFLLQKVSATLSQTQTTLANDVPNLAQKVAAWQASCQRLGLVEPQLVHGDYFPGNVLVNEVGEVTAVLDFSPMTVVGDWRMDLITAMLFLEVTAVYDPQDSHIAKTFVDKILGFDSSDLATFYRQYYAFYFSFTKESDTPLYQWCVANLNK